MIKTFKSKRADYLIDKLLGNQGILDLNPVIAGGSALVVYRLLRMYDSDSKWLELKRKIDTGSIKNIIIDKYGDIDIWLLSDNPVHNKEHELHWLVDDVEDDAASTNKLNPSAYDDSNVCRKNNKLGLVLKSTSKWANSYNFSSNKGGLIQSGSIPIQFVKTTPKSSGSLLESFDFINCSVAWHDGAMYYDSRLDAAFESFELRLNSDIAYLKKSMPSKIFNTLRAFKYAQRYNLDFSPKLAAQDRKSVV